MKKDISGQKSEMLFPKKRTNFEKGKADKRVSDLLARYYVQLYGELCKGKKGNYMSMSYEDIFHNAVLSTIQDPKAASLIADQDILDYFRRKLGIAEMQIIRDNKLLKNKIYADDKQAETETAI